MAAAPEPQSFFRWLVGADLTGTMPALRVPLMSLFVTLAVVFMLFAAAMKTEAIAAAIYRALEPPEEPAEIAPVEPPPSSAPSSSDAAAQAPADTAAAFGDPVSSTPPVSPPPPEQKPKRTIRRQTPAQRPIDPYNSPVQAPPDATGLEPIGDDDIKRRMQQQSVQQGPPPRPPAAD